MRNRQAWLVIFFSVSALCIAKLRGWKTMSENIDKCATNRLNTAFQKTAGLCQSRPA